VRGNGHPSGAYLDMVVEHVAVARSYRIISMAGTEGTVFQRLLVFTTARQRAPARFLARLLSRYPLDPDRG
jgi:hypothetical protein